MPVFHRNVLFTDGDQQEAALEIPDAPPWTIGADIPRLGHFETTARDLFDALAAVRTWLAASGGIILVQGAARDVYPSGMAREAGGRMAYRLRPGVPAQRQDMVDILAPAAADSIVSVTEQREGFDSWIKSLKS